MKVTKKYDRKDLKKLGTHVLNIEASAKLDELLNDVSEWLVNLLVSETLLQRKPNRSS